MTIPLEASSPASSPFPAGLIQRRAGLSSRWLMVILLLMALLPYLNSLQNSFVYDDSTQVLNDPYIRNFHHLREIFTTSVWSYRGNDQSSYYRPLMLVGYLLCYQVFGPTPWIFHAFNVLLNALCVLLVYKVTEQLFRVRSVAFIAAAIFALHPIHTEAVDWIAAVTDLELCLFYLLAFWFFLRLGDSVVEGMARRVLLQIGMVTSFVLALLSKEPAVTLPAVATIFEYGYRDDRDRTSWWQKAGRYGPLWVVTAGYFLLRVRLLGSAFTARANLDLTNPQVLFSASALVGQYAWKLLWPVRLCAYYTFSVNWAVLLPWAAVGAVALLSAGAFLLLEWRRERLPTLAIVWIFSTLLPVLNARWMAANVFTERYLYLPSVGFCWLVAWLLVKIWQALSNQQIARIGMAGALVALAFLSAARIILRNRDWRNDVTLYTQTLRLEPRAYWIRNNLGMVHWNQSNVTAAEQEWRKALELAPYAGVVCDNLGMLDTTLKRYAEATTYLNRALQIDPQDTNAHRNLGIAYEAMGRDAEAERELRLAVDVAPLDVKAHNQLGEFYMDKGRFAEAQGEFRRSVSIEPGIKGYMDLGLAEWRLGHLGLAESAFKSAETFDPLSSHPHFLLALFYGATGRTPDAEREYAAGFKIDPHNADALAAYGKLRSQNPHAQRTLP